MKMIARALLLVVAVIFVVGWYLSLASVVARGILGGITAFIFLLWFQYELVASARAAKPDRGVLFWDLIVTGADEKYSLSRLQLYLWFGVIITAYTAVCFAKGTLIQLSDGLNLLLGINAAAAVAATAIAAIPPTAPVQTPPAAAVVPAAPAPAAATKTAPNFGSDIFFEKTGSLDLPRTQMFAWTVVIILGFIFVVVKSFKAGQPELPDIPPSLAALMGISHGAYLGAKAVPQKKSDGTA